MQMEIRGQVMGGGGEFTDIFNTRVSCLVCAKVGTPKYMVRWPTNACTSQGGAMHGGGMATVGIHSIHPSI